MNKMVYLMKEEVKNLHRSALCSQRKLIDWQTKNGSSGDEGSDSGSEEKIYQYLTGS